MMSERSHHHNPAAHCCSWPTLAKMGRSLSNSSAISNCEPHDFNRLRASAAVGPKSREADGCPSFLEKRDRRERSFFIEKAHSACRFSPQGHRVHAPCPNKRRKIVCHRVSNNEDTDPHTILNALLVLAMIERKLYSYQNARFKNKTVSEGEEEVNDVFSQHPLYRGRAGSDVIGCHRPTGGVFIYVCFKHGSC